MQQPLRVCAYTQRSFHMHGGAAQAEPCARAIQSITVLINLPPNTQTKSNCSSVVKLGSSLRRWAAGHRDAVMATSPLPQNPVSSAFSASIFFLALGLHAGPHDCLYIYTRNPRAWMPMRVSACASSMHAFHHQPSCASTFTRHSRTARATHPSSMKSLASAKPDLGSDGDAAPGSAAADAAVDAG